MRSALALSLVGLWLMSGLALILPSAGDAPKTGPATEKRFPPLKLPPGFKATLFACDPLIEYPSVISIGPKPGAIFAAIDYMTGLGTDGKVKSEIRLVEDTDGDGYADKATTIAKGFNSIQGLAYHDGTLFVMHAPFLTTLRYPWKQPEGGIAIPYDRKDILSGLGLKPEDNPSRLHCANGVVVGHDGWLYLALGDNGINVLRPEGDRLLHNGGAILRCRPDGRDLHIFSTGLRNIYDIALDAELNVFTRDNENDGGTYMIRVLHSFFGADHGYPYDYEERPDHAMKPIGDFGLGSSAGGVCYLETQFPKEYRGNLFFCEWGKSVVRYDLKRQGSDFAPVKEIEFASGDSKDTYPFKPTDIVVQRDGTMMIADYADGQRPKRGRGRIYHVRYVGKDTAPIDTKKGLDSESQFDRWEAQAAIQRTGKMPAWDTLGPRGRSHAIWALVHRDGLKAINRLLDIADKDPDMGVRAQAIRAVADLADPVLVNNSLDAGRGDPALAKRIADLGAKVTAPGKLEVVIALSRLRWADAPAWTLQHLNPTDPALRHAAMHLLRRSDNWPEVLKLLDLPDVNPMRAIAIHALADQYVPGVVDDLVRRLNADREADRRREYARLLTRVQKKAGAWKYWGYRPGPRPANTEAWEKSGRIEQALNDVLGGGDRDLCFAVLAAMRREKIPMRSASLGRWLKDERDPARAAVIIAALEEHTDGLRYLAPVVLDKCHSVANRLRAFSALPKGHDMAALAAKLEDGPVLAEVIRRVCRPNDGTGPPGVVKALPDHFLANLLKSMDAQVRAAAVTALAVQGARSWWKVAMQLLNDPDIRVRRAAAAAAGHLDAEAARDTLVQLLAGPDLQLRGACLESLGLLRDSRGVPAAVQALRQREIDMKALHYLTVQGGPDQIDAVVAFAKENPASNVPGEVVSALLEWRAALSTTAAQRVALDNAIAHVHGATGVLARWHVKSGVPADATGKIVDAVGDKTPFDWPSTTAEGAESRLLLEKAFPDKKNMRWLAATSLTVPAETSVEFSASSHGSLHVWLNGKLIYQRQQPRKFQIDSDRFSAALAKGTNRLIVSTSSNNGAAEFHLRFRKKSGKAAHEKLTQAALSRTGNAERGRKVFFDKEKAQCIKCHQLGNQGERIGPELTGVGARFSRIYLVESILEPSRTVAPSFGTWTVTLKNGKIFNGVKISDDAKALTLADQQGQRHVLAKVDIEEQNASPVSTMPDGLEARLTEEEFVDLIAFLASQKDSPSLKR